MSSWLMPNHVNIETLYVTKHTEHTRVRNGVKCWQALVDLCAWQNNAQPKMPKTTASEPVIVSESQWSKLLTEFRFLPDIHEVGACGTLGDRWHKVRKTADHSSTTALCVEGSEGQWGVGCFWKLDRVTVPISPRTSRKEHGAGDLQAVRPFEDFWPLEL